MKLLSRVRLFATPWTVAHQAPHSIGCSRQEYWSAWGSERSSNLPRFTGLSQQRSQHKASGLPVHRRPSKAAHAGSGHSATLLSPKSTLCPRTLAGRYWPTGRGGAQLASSEAEAIWCVRKMPDDALGGEGTPEATGDPVVPFFPSAWGGLSLGHGSLRCVYCPRSPDPGWAFCDCSQPHPV